MIFSRLSFDQISAFYRQVAAMLRTGVPLHEAITTLSAERELPGIRRRISQIRKDMVNGLSFEESLANHPDIFNPVLTRVLTSDYPAERISDILLKFAETTEKSGNIRNRITTILYYPFIVYCIAFVVTCLLLAFVIPVFEEMLSGFGGQLPAPTAFVFDISRIVSTNLLSILIVFFFVIALLALKKKLFYFIASKLPIIGPLFKNIAISNFAEYFSLMLSIDVPIKEAMEKSAYAVNNPYYSEMFKRMADKTSDIGKFREQASRRNIFPKMLIKSLEVSDNPQNLCIAMEETAYFYNKNFVNSFQKKSILLEVILLVVLGLTIGGLVISMYLPVFYMGSTIG